jgi:hypothetical protein
VHRRGAGTGQQMVNEFNAHAALDLSQ